MILQPRGRAATLRALRWMRTAVQQLPSWCGGSFLSIIRSKVIQERGTLDALVESRLEIGKFVAFACDPDVQSRQQEDAQHQSCHQAADDYDGEGALRVLAYPARQSCGQ